MDRLRILRILHFGFMLVVFRSAHGNKSQHRALSDYLLHDYGTRIRPVATPETRTNVTFRPLFISLLDMDIKNQKVKLTAAVKTIWKDEFLRWNTSDFDGINTIHLSTERIWIPDITLILSSEPAKILSDSPVQIYNDGTVHYFYSAGYTSVYNVYVKWFPFDTQVCVLSFSSWVYLGNELELFPDLSADATQNRFLYNGVWDLIDMSNKKTTSHYLCCEYPYYEVHYRLVLKREPSFYINYLILPVILISWLSVTVFFLPPEMPSKLQFSITNLLALAIFQNLIAGTIPPVAVNTPVIELYFKLMIIMVGASVLSTVAVVNISNRYRESIPRWMEMFVLKVVAPIVCLRKVSEQVQYNEDEEAVPTDKNIDEKTRNTSLKPYTVNGLNSEQLHESTLITMANITNQRLGGDEDDEDVNIHRHAYRNIALVNKWKMIGLVVSRCFALLFAACVFACTTTILIYIKIMSDIEFDEALGKDREKWLNETVFFYH